MPAASSAAVALQDLVAGARLLAGLGGYLRDRVAPDQARADLRRRIEAREQTFLSLALSAIYSRPSSPYRPLLRRAGCEYGDLEALVRHDGLEAALGTLYRQGVYLSVDELKGRRPVGRGGERFCVRLDQLAIARSRGYVKLQSGGSRGAPGVALTDFGNIRARALNTGLPLDARGGSRWATAVWGVAGGLTTVLQYSLIGARPRRFFLQVDPSAAGLRAAYLWSGRAARWASLLAGRPLPAPECHPLDEPLPIARWMSSVLRAGGVPHLDLAASSAVRLCQSAEAHGVDLAGAQLTLGREPVTAARLAAVRRVGAVPLPRYAATECGPIAYGCLRPTRPDEAHVHHDTHALIRADPADASGLPAGTLLLTALQPSAALMLLNVSLGDQAELATGACGCAVEQLGWTTRLHTIRSAEKLTGEGMTFYDTDVIRILEEVLPSTFGGGPTDYQLLEREDADGRARLSLLVHPSVRVVDPAAVAETFLSALANGNDTERQMAAHWRQTRIVEVQRRPPAATAQGKILHLHQQRSGASR